MCERKCECDCNENLVDVTKLSPLVQEEIQTGQSYWETAAYDRRNRREANRKHQPYGEYPDERMARQAFGNTREEEAEFLRRNPPIVS